MIGMSPQCLEDVKKREKNLEITIYTYLCVPDFLCIDNEKVLAENIFVKENKTKKQKINRETVLWGHTKYSFVFVFEAVELESPMPLTLSVTMLLNFVMSSEKRKINISRNFIITVKLP